jgi:hypothetical protein
VAGYADRTRSTLVSLPSIGDGVCIKTGLIDLLFVYPNVEILSI